MSDSKISGLIVAGLLAVFGTVAGGLVKGYWDTNLAQMDFQSRLILRALEPEDVKNRVSSLKFLVMANLISDPSVRDGLKTILEEGEESVPQFTPVRAPTTIDSSFGVNEVDSPRKRIVEKFVELKGKNVALIGFRVRCGDIIDALTPIYAEVTKNLELKGEFEGDRIGREQGAEFVLKQSDGYVVTGIKKTRGEWFGRREVVHIEIRWNRLTRNGIDPTDTKWSEKLGGGLYARGLETELLSAKENAFISDFAAATSRHTGEEPVLHDIKISETVIVRND